MDQITATPSRAPSIRLTRPFITLQHHLLAMSKEQMDCMQGRTGHSSRLSHTRSRERWPFTVPCPTAYFNYMALYPLPRHEAQGLTQEGAGQHDETRLGYQRWRRSPSCGALSACMGGAVYNGRLRIQPGICVVLNRRCRNSEAQRLLTQPRTTHFITIGHAAYPIGSF
jgi:hypothetical protein